jgi:shikimate kinase
MTLSNPPRAIFLVGFMGAGKTSVGRQLAHRLGWRFLDLDELIEERQGRSIAEIFRDSGEAAFRREETAALLELLKNRRQRRLVVALGGGAFAQPLNLQALKRSALPVIFLDAPLEELRRRCGPKADTRPLFQDENQFRQLYEARRSSYMQADLRVETAGQTVEETVTEVVARMGLSRPPARKRQARSR